jgi:hypothetical protein
MSIFGAANELPNQHHFAADKDKPKAPFATLIVRL